MSPQPTLSLLINNPDAPHFQKLGHAIMPTTPLLSYFQKAPTHCQPVCVPPFENTSCRHHR